MPRLGHKKSRNGCRQCKARHVKCDENRPCSSCARHGVQCSLVTWDPNAPPPAPIKREVSATPSASRVSRSIPQRARKPSTQGSTTSLPIDYVLNPSPAPTPGSSEGESPYSQSDTYPFLTRFATKTEVIQPNYWMGDLELMHHWTIETYYFMSARDSVRTFWRMEAPKLAMNHPFLLHEILAISALHKAYLQPNQRKPFYALGIHHQDLAIREMRKTLPHLNADNVGAMFGTGAVISLTAFASTGIGAHEPSTKPRPPIEDLLDIFALQQGMYSILSQNHSHVLAGPFAILLSDANASGEPEAPLLFSISAQIHTVSSFLDSQNLAPPVRTEVLKALISLKTCLDFSNAPEASTRELRFLYFWPNYLSQAFLNMLRSNEPAALIVLAYYAVAFRSSTDFFWFLDGWAERILRAIAEAVEPSWQPILRWPWESVMGTQHDHQLAHQQARNHDGLAPPHPHPNNQHHQQQNLEQQQVPEQTTL